jgi:hypothetical protein
LYELTPVHDLIMLLRISYSRARIASQVDVTG